MSELCRRLVLTLVLWAGLAMPAAAGPYIWDQDEDGIDDRMESVHALGYGASFESADTLSRQRFEVSRVPGDLVYGMYVVYDTPPTSADLLALTALGLPVHSRLTSVPAVRSTGTFAQALLARDLPRVERIEVIPLLYPGLVDGAAAIGRRDDTQRVFPAWDTGGGASTGFGVIVGILDTGVNDQPDGGYPGHESLAGRCMGGASFTAGDSALDTPKGGSMNPADHGGNATHAHGTHVAAIAVGTGGPLEFARGIAPGARFVDVKALNDAGVGVAVAEAIDWCIAQRTRNWGDPDPAWRGIDVLNLSLSSIDPSDGNDVASRAAARAVQLGMVVVASMGNEGTAAFVPSPAAGDGVIAVGAWDVQRSGPPADDLWPAFNDIGPRASDGDSDVLDELKPTVLAPGVAVLSADGDPASDGAQYRRGSGTSPAAAFVAGAAALLLSEAPSLTPVDITRLLTTTARRTLPDAPAGTGGADPRWTSTLGYGLIDLAAARLELLAPGVSQVCGLELGGADSTLTAAIVTQRERGAAWFALERAPDVAGVPGVFAVMDSAAAAGDSSLAGAVNRTSYAFARPVPPGERGAAFWYRAAFFEGGLRRVGPARRYASPVGASAATLEVTIIHNAYDHDISADVDAVTPFDGPAQRLHFAIPASSAAVATDWVTGLAASGNIAHTFRVEVPAGAAEACLPPSPGTPWTLAVTEGGYLNRSGRIASFRLIHHSKGGDVTYEGSPTMLPTFEGAISEVRMPAGVTGVGPALFAGSALRAFPSPLPAGGSVTFRAPAGSARAIEIVNLAGRRVGRVALEAVAGDGAGADLVGHWTARDAGGRALPSGVYFLRSVGAAAPAGRLVILPR